MKELCKRDTSITLIIPEYVIVDIDLFVISEVHIFERPWYRLYAKS